MCGIFAVLGRSDSSNIAALSIVLLQNRGYDSCGISRCINGSLETVKFASTTSNDSVLSMVDHLSRENPCLARAGATILHTRWATTGRPSDINAHPHHDNKHRVAIIHNGIIENYIILKDFLMKQGYVFESDTDTEIIAVMIGRYLDKGKSIQTAIQLTVKRLAGTWALVIIHRDFPNRMWITRNGSPLLLGLEDTFVMIASEQIAFGDFIKQYIILDNHDLLEISSEYGRITYNSDIRRYTINDKVHTCIDTHPTGYLHWMDKEIREQPAAIVRAMNTGGRIASDTTVKLGGLDLQKVRLESLNNIIIIGCGTSYNAAQWCVDIFRSLNSFSTVNIFEGAEFNVKDIPRSGNSGIIFVSQSGETKELHRCLQLAKELDIITIGVINVVDSLIARETDCGVYLNAGREVAVASTKSFTSQCIILSMIAVWFSQLQNTHVEKRRQIINDLNNLSFQVRQIFQDNIYRRIDGLTSRIEKYGENSMFIMGKGGCSAIAAEGALKLKEVAYLHAEGLSSSALKHGPLALITSRSSTIVLDIGDDYRDNNCKCYNEICARDAIPVRITDNTIFTDIDIHIDLNRTFGGLIAAVVLQLLSYSMALTRGHNPDYPRNLAKCVTVD
jgi:glucosamine--fructose-6-phosphate aminotransferase (isomerizing)